MKSKYVLIFLFCLFFIGPFNIHADCSNSEISRLKKIASNVNISYEPIETDSGVTYNIIFLNMTNELVIRDTQARVSYPYTGNEMILTGYKPNTNYKFKILPSNGCDIALVVKYANLPAFNAYYKDPLCIGIEEYSLCQKWNNSNVSYDSFVKQVTKYRESLNNSNNKPEEIVKPTIIDIIFNFLANYYYIICLAIIIILVPIIIILKRREKLI